MKSLLGIRLLSVKPAATSSARQYGEVLFNEKLRKCASLSQVQSLLDAPVSGLGPGRCIRILNELGRFEPSPEVLEKLYSVAKTHRYTALEAVQFCRAIAGLKPPPGLAVPPPRVPEFIVASVREMGLDSFTSQSALDSLRTLERFPELEQLQSVRDLAKIAVEDLGDLSVSQICAMAKHLSAQQISAALLQRDFEPLSLVECWDVLAFCGEGNPQLIAKLTTEAIQNSTKQFGIPRLARAFWHAGSPDKLLQNDEALKRLDDPVSAFLSFPATVTLTLPPPHRTRRRSCWPGCTNSSSRTSASSSKCLCPSRPAPPSNCPRTWSACCGIWRR